MCKSTGARDQKWLLNVKGDAPSRNKSGSGAERSSRTSQCAAQQLLHCVLPREGGSHYGAQADDASKNEHQEAGPPAANKGLEGAKRLGVDLCTTQASDREQDLTCCLSTPGPPATGPALPRTCAAPPCR